MTEKKSGTKAKSKPRPKSVTKKKSAPLTVARETEKLRTALFSADSSVEGKEVVLIELAHMGEREANEVIREFLASTENDSDEHLHSWAEMALDEGEFMASVPKNKAEEERMLKEEVYQDYMDQMADLYGELEEAEWDARKAQYEYEVAQRLAKKSKSKGGGEQERLELSELAYHDIMVWMDGRCARLQERYAEVEEMLSAIEEELKS